MKYCHRFPVCFLFLVSLVGANGLAIDAYCQSPMDEFYTIDSVMPTLLTEQELLRAIAGAKEPVEESKVLLRGILQFQLKILRSEDAYYDRMRKPLNRMRHELSHDANDFVSESRGHAANTEVQSGMPMVDRETTALLMRNCLIELQRVQWELAVEKGVPEAKNSNVGDELSKALAERKEELKKFEKVVEHLSEMRERSKGAGQQGEAVNLEFQLSKARRELDLAELRLRAAQQQFESLGSVAVESATKVAQLTEKVKAINRQLDSLKRQRDDWVKVESLQIAASESRKRSEALAERVAESELQERSRQIKIQAIEEALQALDSHKAEPVPNAEK